MSQNPSGYTKEQLEFMDNWVEAHAAPEETRVQTPQNPSGYTEEQLAFMDNWVEVHQC